MKLRWTIVLAWLGLCIAAGAMSLGFLQVGDWELAVAVWVCVPVGILAGQFRWQWAPSVILIANCCAAAIGIWMVTWPGFPLLGLVGSLVALDMFHFSWRVEAAMRVGGDAGGVENRHMRRLFAVLGSGMALYLVSWLAQIRLNFGFALILGLIAVLGISLGVNARRRSSL